MTTSVNTAAVEQQAHAEHDVVFERLFANVTIPKYQTEGAAAFDVAPFFEQLAEPISGFDRDNNPVTYTVEVDGEGRRYIVLKPYDRVKLPTGLRAYIRKGFALEARGRSSAIKHTLRLCNGVGTLDSDYRGELFIPVENVGARNQLVYEERLAQFIYHPVKQAGIGALPFGSVLETYFGSTERGTGGFGSTGS